MTEFFQISLLVVLGAGAAWCFAGLVVGYGMRLGNDIFGGRAQLSADLHLIREMARPGFGGVPIYPWMTEEQKREAFAKTVAQGKDSLRRLDALTPDSGTAQFKP